MHHTDSTKDFDIVLHSCAGDNSGKASDSKALELLQLDASKEPMIYLT